MRQERIQTKLITRGYLDDRLHDRWQAWFSQSMEGRTPRINSDFHPLGVFFSLSHWNALFSPYLSRIFQGFEKFTFKPTLTILTVFSFLMVTLFIKKPSASIQSIPYAIFTTGLSGMIFNLAIIFTFQTLYGYLYHQIGASGNHFYGGNWTGEPPDDQTSGQNQRSEPPSFWEPNWPSSFSLFCLPFAFSLLAISPVPSKGEPWTSVLRLLFWILSFLLGFIMGLQFPLSTSIYLDCLKKRTLGRQQG